MKSIQMTPPMPLCQPAVSPDTAIHPEIVYRMIRLRRRLLGTPVVVAERVLWAVAWGRGEGGGLRA